MLPPICGVVVLNAYPDVVRRGTSVVVFGLVVEVITSVVFVSVKKIYANCYI